jgi:hypothetical protein
MTELKEEIKKNKEKWEDGYNNLETKMTRVTSPAVLGVRRTCCVNSALICVHK